MTVTHYHSVEGDNKPLDAMRDPMVNRHFPQRHGGGSTVAAVRAAPATDSAASQTDAAPPVSPAPATGAAPAAERAVPQQARGGDSDREGRSGGGEGADRYRAGEDEE